MTKEVPKFLVKHVGNMGDLIFFVPPILFTLKEEYPHCHITLITAWGFKDNRGRLGKRNQDGSGIALMMTNPHVDQLVHWHDQALSLEGNICEEEGNSFPTWNKEYYEAQKSSGKYDAVYELDIGLPADSDPLKFLYSKIGLSEATYTNYQLYLTQQDKMVASSVLADYPRPLIVLLESLNTPHTRSWDPAKAVILAAELEKTYGVSPFWFGEKYVPYYEGRRLTLRENIALLSYADLVIGVMSGPMHFAAAVGAPTIALYGDVPIERVAPAYFLNRFIMDPKKKHRTLLGPTGAIMTYTKPDKVSPILTPNESVHQGFVDWQHPGRQATKGPIAAITVDEVMAVTAEVLGDPTHFN